MVDHVAAEALCRAARSGGGRGRTEDSQVSAPARPSEGTGGSAFWQGRGPAAVLLHRGAPAGRAGTGRFSRGWGGAAGLERCAAR